MRSQDVRAHISELSANRSVFECITGSHGKISAVLDPFGTPDSPVNVEREFCNLGVHLGKVYSPKTRWRSLDLKAHNFVCQNALEPSEEVKHALVVWTHGKTIETPVDDWKAWEIWIYMPGKVLGKSGK